MVDLFGPVFCLCPVFLFACVPVSLLGVGLASLPVCLLVLFPPCVFLSVSLIGGLTVRRLVWDSGLLVALSNGALWSAA